MVEILLTSSVLILALALLRLAGNRVSARLRYALWALVLVRLLLPAGLIQSPVSVMNVPPVLERRIAPVGGGLPDALPKDPVPAVSAPAAADPVGGDVPIAPPVAVDPMESPSVAPPSSVDWAAVLKWVWLAGACAVGGYFLLSNLLFYRKLRLSAEHCPEIESSLPVYRADFLPSPCMAGLLRPAIYLNAAALGSGEGLRHVLAHETCHKRHGDNWWALLRCLCLAVWWFDPLVWLAAWLSRRDCELACDESALKLLGEGERIPYGKTLVGLTARPAPTDLLRCSTAMTASGKALKERIRCLAMNKRMSKALLGLVLAAALTLGLCTLTGAQAATPGKVDVGEYYVRLSNGQYTWNPNREGRRGGFAVVKEEWDSTLKDLDPSLVEVSYPTALETKDVMMNINASWAMAFGQQFYHLPADHPCRAEDVQVSYAGTFSSIYKTASGGAKIINETTVGIQFELIPTGDMEKAAEYLGGQVSTMTINDKKTTFVSVYYSATMTRKTETNGTTTWTCTRLKAPTALTEEEQKPSGNYTPTALPVTVAPKEGWQLSELDSDVIAIPDLGWNPNNETDSREMRIRAAMAFAQEFYALKPGHPYRSSEVRILESELGDFIIAVKPEGGVEAVEPYFKGGCPKGVGELEGFVLLNYSLYCDKETIAAFGKKPVYTIHLTQHLSIGPPNFDPDADLSVLSEEERMVADTSCYFGVEAGGNDRQTAAEQWARQYVKNVVGYGRGGPGQGYYDARLLSIELTGRTEGYAPETIAFQMTYAFLPTWGANAAMTYHKGQCALGTGDLEGYVIRTIPVVYLQNTEGNYWCCVGLCTMGDGLSADSRWIDAGNLESSRNKIETTLTAPPVGVTWVAAN